MKPTRDSLNTTFERFLMWALHTADRRMVGSPSLAMLGLRPTLRWVWSGASAHAARVHR